MVDSSRRVGIVGASAALLALSLGLFAAAQAPEKKDAPPESPAAKQAPAGQPAAGQAAPGQGAPAGNPPAAEGASDVSFLRYCWNASPVFFVGMGLLSIYFGTIVVDHFLRLRLRLIVPPTLVHTLDAMLNEKKYKEAYEAAKADPSLFGRAITAGVERLTHGFDRAMDALVAVAEEGKMDMEHRASNIATIGQMSPMLGLLGTVLGMVLSFQEIAKGGQPKPAELANNIGLALVSTLEGLILAIPAIYFFALFRNRIARLIYEVESLGELYLWRFSAAVKK